MSNFVRVQVGNEADVDLVNRDHIVRVHAEAVGDAGWVVKVLVATGLELVDSRHGTAAEAAARVADLTA